MPTIEEELDRGSQLYSLLMPVMSQFVPGLDKGKGIYFLFIKSEAKSLRPQEDSWSWLALS
ncbi:hypothetical protein CCACVL1_11419 [Corchorus capsularis]|uniref:Uncharacterized protein n=1 Tax=Corchorus capsularis TaxID=210143 RepID=A0A1R3IL82_COCAP|nr:hypothetical protein CCACVL1_11419 [Corchorus capsularis]